MVKDSEGIRIKLCVWFEINALPSKNALTRCKYTSVQQYYWFNNNGVVAVLHYEWFYVK